MAGDKPLAKYIADAAHAPERRVSEERRRDWTHALGTQRCSTGAPVAAQGCCRHALAYRSGTSIYFLLIYSLFFIYFFFIYWKNGVQHRPASGLCGRAGSLHNYCKRRANCEHALEYALDYALEYGPTQAK